MASGTCFHFGMQEDAILEHTNDKCQLRISVNLSTCMNTCESRRHYLKYNRIYILNQHTKFKCYFRMTKTISNGKS